MKKLIPLIWVFLPACASMQQSYQDQVCNENGGYERGMNDARAGHPMDQSFALACVPGTRDVAQSGYRAGYNSGLASLQGENPPASGGITVNIGVPQSQNGFYCEVHAFTSTFSAWGDSELEARVNAKNKCTQQYNEMHCNDLQCRHS